MILDLDSDLVKRNHNNSSDLIENIKSLSKIKVNPISGIDYTGGATYVGGGGGSPVGNHENPYTTLAVQPPLPPPPSSSTDHLTGSGGGYPVYNGAGPQGGNSIGKCLA